MRVKKQFILPEDREFKSSHASSLVYFQNKIYVAYFGGPFESHKEVSIWISVGERNQYDVVEFTSPQKIRAGDFPHWNPVLFVYRGELRLVFKIGPNPREWKSCFTSSKDGLNWSPIEITKGQKGPVRCKPLLTSEGKLIAGGSTETFSEWRSQIYHLSEMDSKEWWTGVNLEDPDFIKGKGVIQPTLWESHKGYVHAMFRSTNGYIARADSIDNGVTWGMIYPINFPNNNSGIDVVNFGPNMLYLVCNPVSGETISGSDRFPLSVFASTDNGFLEWDKYFDLEAEGPGEFSYPAMIQVNGYLMGTYTWNRKNIVFWETVNQVPMV